SDLERAVRTCGLDWDPIKAVRVFDESCIHHVPAVISHPAQHLYDFLSGAAPAAPDAKRNADQLEADGRARDRLQLDQLRQSRACAHEAAEALRRTQVRLDQETESLKLLERQLRLTEERLNHTEERLNHTEERLSQSVREADQVWVAYRE